MRNKKLINRRNDITQGWQLYSPPWKRKGKKGKKYDNTGFSCLVTHSSTNAAEQGLTLSSRQNMLSLLNFKDDKRYKKEKKKSLIMHDWESVGQKIRGI